jgi:hypothetical protein
MARFLDIIRYSLSALPAAALSSGVCRFDFMPSPPCLLSLIATLLCVGCCTSNHGTRSKRPIAVTIPYDTHGERSTAIDYGPPGTHFHIHVQNVSAKPVKLWEEWCSWGYFTLQLEVYDRTGARHLLKKKPTDFYINFPSSLTLKPGDAVVWDVQLTSAMWEDCFWLAEGEDLNTKVRAIYKVEPDEESREHGVWTGHAVSPLYDFHLFRPASR